MYLNYLDVANILELYIEKHSILLLNLASIHGTEPIMMNLLL